MIYPEFPTYPGVEFRIIPGYVGYAASDNGIIWSCRKSDRWRDSFYDHWRPLRVKVRKQCGRHFVDLTKDKITKHHRVSKLVALTFIGAVPKGYVVAHYPDKSLSNNSAANLKIVTESENSRHRLEHGTLAQGGQSHLAKLTDEIAILVRDLYDQGFPVNALSKLVGCCRHTVMNIGKRRTFKHLP
jgi:hypothetical protein